MRCVERDSPCKVNLLLNILGKRPDGFHTLETVMQPVPLYDTLSFESRPGSGVELTCSNPVLPVDHTNLVHRAATAFFDAVRIKDGVGIHLEKRLPLAAGLGAGSANAAVTLLVLNDTFGSPLDAARLEALAATLGSDVPFFLQSNPAVGIDRGQRITPLAPFQALRGKALFLFHPGFGVSTAWAYQSLAAFPKALHGVPGRAERLISLLQKDSLCEAGSEIYNSLEAPVLHKYPILRVYQDFLREHGAEATLMSGSGSTTFALFKSENIARQVENAFRSRFGPVGWLAITSFPPQVTCSPCKAA